MIQFTKKNVTAFLLFALAGMLTCVGLQTMDLSKESEVSIQQEGEQDYLQIYLMDADQLLVPLAIAQEQDLDSERQIEVMLAYLCGKQKFEGFSSFFAEADILNDVEVSQDCATLNFNTNFLSYEPEEELRLLESLVWGCTQFQDVEQVRLQMDGQDLSAMPLEQTPLSQPLTRSIGINHFESSNATLHDSVSLLVYGTKKINGTHYLVPRSRRVSNTVCDSFDKQVEAVIQDLSASSTLSSTLEEHAIELSMEETGILDLSVDETMFSSDRSLKQDDVNELILSLSALSTVEGIRLHCMQESAGCMDGEVITAKNLQYNIIEP